MDMRRFCIRVDDGNDYDIQQLQLDLTKVVRIMSSIPRLEYVHLVHWNVNMELDLDRRGLALHNFKYLRNVKEPVLDGVPTGVAGTLAKDMTSSSPPPSNHLLHMYDALALYAKPFDFLCNIDMECAELCVAEDSLEVFCLYRLRVLKGISVYKAKAMEHMYDHDARDEDGEFPVINRGETYSEGV
jgi:hypothetical protein